MATVQSVVVTILLLEATYRAKRPAGRWTSWTASCSALLVNPRTNWSGWWSSVSTELLADIIRWRLAPVKSSDHYYTIEHTSSPNDRSRTTDDDPRCTDRLKTNITWPWTIILLSDWSVWPEIPALTVRQERETDRVARKPFRWQWQPIRPARYSRRQF